MQVPGPQPRAALSEALGVSLGLRVSANPLGGSGRLLKF